MHEYIGGTRVRTLGRLDVLLYPFYKNDIANEFPNEMKAISEAKQKITELNSKISDLRGTKKCTGCGNTIPNDSVFCLKCGQKVDNEAEVFYDDEDTEITSDLIIPNTFTDIIDDDDAEII